jgi:hypothetical protein
MSAKRVLKATLFILIQALIASLLSSVISPTWIAMCGVLGAALAALLLILLAGDEKSAQLFFAENWQELEETGTPVVGLIVTVIGLIWLIPVLCLVLTLMLIVLSRLDLF